MALMKSCALPIFWRESGARLLSGIGGKCKCLFRLKLFEQLKQNLAAERYLNTTLQVASHQSYCYFKLFLLIKAATKLSRPNNSEI